MANYISKSDVETVFGISNVATWSNLDNTQAGANEDRIDAAIAYAEAAINDWLRGGRYAVPITGTSVAVPRVVVDWAAKYAGVWLYQSRGQLDTDETGNKLTAIKEAVDAEIGMYVSGQRRLAATLTQKGPDAPVVP